MRRPSVRLDPRPRLRARLGVLLGAVTAVAVLAGCATLPSSGPVRPGKPQDSTVGARDSFVRVNPPGPRPGAGPEEVVRGFLLASADFEGDHATARQFLDGATSQRWQPDAGVVVLATPYTVAASARARSERDARPAGQAVVRLAGSSTATIDAAGRYAPTTPEQAVVAPFSLRRNEQGEWRITNLRDGLYLPRHEIDRVYRPRYLYFLTPDRDHVVPDPVLVPSARNVATALVRGLVRGPAPEAGSALRTAFPAGTKPPATVSVIERVAEVDFGGDVLAADPQAREQLAAQLVWTLRQLREDIDAVRITAGGAAFVPEAAVPQLLTSWSAYDPAALPLDTRPYLALERRLGRLEPDTFVPLPGPAGSGRPPLRTPAVSPDLTRLAAVSTDGRRLYAGLRDEPLPPRLAGTNLGEASYDENQMLWVLDREPNAVWLVPPQGATMRVQLPRLPGPVKALRVSRDGTRVAVGLSVPGAADQLRVGFVERSGTAVRVRSLRRVAPQLSVVADVAWAGADSVAVLGQENSAVPQAYLVTVDGYAVEDRGAVPNRAVSLTAARNLNLFVGTATGQVFEAVGRQWVGRGRGQDPTYPG